jgi:hypothetical protein
MIGQRRGSRARKSAGLVSDASLAGREGFEPSEDVLGPQSLSRRPHSTTLAPSRALCCEAEREGFEPPDLSVNCFQDSRLKPLGHLSALCASVRYERTGADGLFATCCPSANRNGNCTVLQALFESFSRPILTTDLTSARPFRDSQRYQIPGCFSMISCPPRYPRKTSGTTIEPSGCW